MKGKQLNSFEKSKNLFSPKLLKHLRADQKMFGFFSIYFYRFRWLNWHLLDVIIPILDPKTVEIESCNSLRTSDRCLNDSLFQRKTDLVQTGKEIAPNSHISHQLIYYCFNLLIRWCGLRNQAMKGGKSSMGETDSLKSTVAIGDKR